MYALLLLGVGACTCLSTLAWLVGATSHVSIALLWVVVLPHSMVHVANSWHQITHLALSVYCDWVLPAAIPLPVAHHHCFLLHFGQCIGHMGIMRRPSRPDHAHTALQPQIVQLLVQLKLQLYVRRMLSGTHGRSQLPSSTLWALLPACDSLSHCTSAVSCSMSSCTPLDGILRSSKDVCSVSKASSTLMPCMMASHWSMCDAVSSCCPQAGHAVPMDCLCPLPAAVAAACPLPRGCCAMKARPNFFNLLDIYPVPRCTPGT